MTSSRKYAKELTGDEFVKIISAQPSDQVVKQYLQNEYNSSGANLRVRIDESVQKNEPRSRNIIPINFVSMTFQQGAGINGQDDFPYYTIIDPIEIKDMTIIWNVTLSRCQFSENLKFTNCSFDTGLSFSNCFFRKGATFENIRSNQISFSNIESMTNVRFIKCDFNALYFSDIALLPNMENCKINNFSLYNKFK